MHELALMEDLVDTVTSGIGSSKVHVVRLVVGREACASPHALKFCFELCTHGTALEGAALDIVETPGADLRLAEVEVT
jgi:hydrogenase nickel incorporation protein HypA/HybF